jgi:ribosomal protein S27AE
VFSGVTIGGSGGGQPMPLVIVTVLVVVMALLTVFNHVKASTGGGVDMNRKIPFLCGKCQAVEYKTVKELREMNQGMPMGPMEPPKVDCPKCGGVKTAQQAIECPECKNVFVISMDPTKGMYDDKCPKCGVSYAEAWKKHMKKK